MDSNKPGQYPRSLSHVLEALALRRSTERDQILASFEAGSASTTEALTLFQNNPEIVGEAIALLERHCQPGFRDSLHENVTKLARKRPHRLLPVLHALANVLGEADLESLLQRYLHQQRRTRQTETGELLETKEDVQTRNPHSSQPQRTQSKTLHHQEKKREAQDGGDRRNKLHEREGLLIGGIDDYLNCVYNLSEQSQNKESVSSSNSLLSYKANVMLKQGTVRSQYMMTGFNEYTDQEEEARLKHDAKQEIGLSADALLQRLKNQEDSFTSDLSPQKGPYQRSYGTNDVGDAHVTTYGPGEGRKREVFEILNPLLVSDTSAISLGDKIFLRSIKNGRFVSPVSGTLNASIVTPSEEDAFEVISPLTIAVERALSREIGPSKISAKVKVPTTLMAALGPRRFALGVNSYTESPPLLVQYCERVLLRTWNGYFLSGHEGKIVLESLSDNELEAIDTAFSSFLGLNWDMILRFMLKLQQPIATCWLLQLWDSICFHQHNLTSSLRKLGNVTWFFTSPNAGFTAEWNILRATLVGVPPLMHLLEDEKLSRQRERSGFTNADTNKLSNYPLPLQEAILVEDCLDALIGSTGRHIQVSFNDPNLSTEDGLHTNSYPLHRLSDVRKAEQSQDRHLFLGDHPMQNAQLVLNSACDPALASLVERILPVANQYMLLRQFVERKSLPEAGMIGQALSSAVTLVLREYTLLVSQLEHLSRVPQAENAPDSLPLSLQQMWFHLQKAARTLSTLHNILLKSDSGENHEIRGGSLLNVLYKAYRTAGDESSRDMIFFLLERSSKPFLQMLQKWIFFGIIDDPTGEFMVQERGDVPEEGESQRQFHANSWNSRYSIVDINVPHFLNTLREPILTTGKYLNALRYSGLPENDVTVPTAKDIAFSPDERDYTPVVQQAYEWASTRLLRYVIYEKDLLGRLYSLKAYFFMSYGDYISNFMDVAEEELAKQIDGDATRESENKAMPTIRSRTDISRKTSSIQRLKSLLELSIRTSVTAMDPYKDEITCRLDNDSLVQHVQRLTEARHGLHHAEQKDNPSIKLKAFNCFTLDYIVEWPLNIVLSQQVLYKYQLLFRHLFYCKHVERRLCRAWTAHQECKELNLRGALSRSYAARQRMLHFMQNLVYYMTFEVIEPHWHEMERSLRSAQKTKTLDDVIRHHENFLDNCLEQCLLTNKELFTLLHKIATLCMLLSEQMAAAIDSNKLTEDEIDQRAGITPEVKNAMNRRRRIRKQRHEEGFGRGEKPGAGTPRTNTDQKSQETEADSWTLSDTQIRMRRVQVQTEAMQHSIAQEKWQKMVQESNDLFDNLLKKFLSKLFKSGQKHFTDHQSHLAHLCARLDYNGFYSREFRESTKTIIR